MDIKTAYNSENT